MKYGISAEEPKKMKVTYIVDKDNRKVICLIENTKRAFEDFINEQDSMLPFVLDGTRELFLKKAKMSNVFRGVATCAPEDEWDEKVGRQIAYARARYKFDVSFFNRANWFIHALDKQIDRLYDTINNYGDKISKKHNYRVERLAEHFGEDFELFKSDKYIAQDN